MQSFPPDCKAPLSCQMLFSIFQLIILVLTLTALLFVFTLSALLVRFLAADAPWIKKQQKLAW